MPRDMLSARAVRAGAVCLGLLACNREVPREAAAGPTPTAASTASKENRVYDVGSVNDLLSVQSSYLQKAAKGEGGRFEVRFTATIPNTGWSLAPEPGKDVPAIDLVLTGKGAVVPVPGKLVARSVRIE